MIELRNELRNSFFKVVPPGMEKDRIFLWAVLAFMIGISLGSFFTLPFLILMLVGGACQVAFLVVFPRKVVFLLGFFYLILLVGAALAVTERHIYVALPALSQIVSGEARIVTDPDDREFFRRIVLLFETCTSGNCPKERILWQAPTTFREEAGTKLNFSCLLELPKNFTPDFDYRMFLAKDGIGYVCLRAKHMVVRPADGESRMRRALYVPKHVFEQALARILSEPEAGLAKGLLLGGNHYLPQELQDAFTRVGVSHMIAVSGYNITIIAEMLLMLGLFFGLWRKHAIWFALSGIILFIIMIGLPASAARAGTMAGIVFLALQTGRLARPERALLFAGAAMLLVNPLLLRYDVGFQLSFLATLGILWVSPYYECFAPRGVILKKIGELLIMTLAVELFVLPVILLTFHTFSPLVIVGNLLIVLIPFAMVTAFASAILFLVVPGAHLVVSWATFGILVLMTHSVEWLGSFHGMSIAAPNFGPPALIIWYILLGFLIWALKKYLPARSYEKHF